MSLKAIAMEIQRVILTNFGLFKNLEISLAPTQQNPSNITVFVGKNGAGKSSILTALATSLSWFTARLRTEKGSGNPIPENSILNSANFASIEIEAYDNNHPSENADISQINHQFKWTLAKAEKGRKSPYNSNLNDCTRLANIYRDDLSDNDQTSLPLIAFYPVERVVLDIPLKIRTKHSFKQLDGYDNALNQGVDFRRFFEWFREREDTENESAIPQDFWNEIRPLLQTDSTVWQQLQQLNASAKDRQLTAVRTAISRFMPDLDNLRVRRKPRLYMAIDKNGETLNAAQLSQGEKSLMALVGDIARRLAMLKPALENP
ncbi:AAA family ATPase [Arthrospira platensis]|uniref:AAA family ATPase n=1 Tax=Limnospira TaxID=2596745 RepID=UPI003D9C46A7